MGSWSKEDKEKAIIYILKELSEGEVNNKARGRAIRKILKDENTPSAETWYKWLKEDEKLSKQYAHACRVRADNIFEEILEIAEDETGDKNKGIPNGVKVQRSRLQIDTYKWVAGKLNPSKYGDNHKEKEDKDEGYKEAAPTVVKVQFQDFSDTDPEDK